jgi:hypothetical protein
MSVIQASPFWKQTLIPPNLGLEDIFCTEPESKYYRLYRPGLMRMLQKVSVAKTGLY